MTIKSIFDLRDKVAVVTGGNRGIGAALVEGLADAGARVVVASRTPGRSEIEHQSLDLGDPASCKALIPRIEASHGRIDILINNGGIGVTGAPQDLALDDWQRIIDVNLTGAFLLCQAAHPLFVRQGCGKIINIGSIATRRGSGPAAAYCASKGGIGQLTMALAAAWGRDNIQVNALLPGYIDTELVTRTRRERPDFDRHVLERTPMGRFGRPEDIVGPALFLASAASDFVTGTLIPVDGGYMSQL